MKCKECGGRSFNIIVRAIQKFWVDENDEWIDSDIEVLDEIEGEGTYCSNCERIVRVIMEKKNEMQIMYL